MADARAVPAAEDAASRRLRRILPTLLLVAPLVLLVVWLAAEQLPIWLAPRASAFAPSPAACEAVDLVAALGGSPGGSPALGEAAARAAAERAAAERFPADAPPAADAFTLHAITLPGGPAWLAIAPLPAAAADAPGPALLIVLEGTIENAALSTNAAPNAGQGPVVGQGPTVIVAALASITGAPDAACAFDTRGALIDLARSSPFVLLVAYVGGAGLGAGMTWLLTRTRRRTGQSTAEDA
jgi:hypothetical protein